MKKILFVIFLFMTASAMANELEMISISPSPTPMAGNNGSTYPVVSLDGNSAAFQSTATNLTGSSYYRIVYQLHDQASEQDEPPQVIPFPKGGVDGDCKYPSINSDGSLFSFECAVDGTSLYNIYVFDRNSLTSYPITEYSIAPTSSSYFSSISRDGNYVVFESLESNFTGGDTEGFLDVFLASIIDDGQGGKSVSTSRISQTAGAAGGNSDSGTPSINSPSLSNGAVMVAFSSDATNLTGDPDSGSNPDIFLSDDGVISKVTIGHDSSEANGYSEQPVISADGRFIAFTSDASNLVLNDTNNESDVFRYEISTKTIYRISLKDGQSDPDGQILNPSSSPSISQDGRYIAFFFNSNIYVRDVDSNTTTLISTTSGGTGGNDVSSSPSISGDGGVVAFASRATNLDQDVENYINPNGYYQIYVSVPDDTPTPTPTATATATPTPAPVPIGGDKTKKEIKEIIKDEVAPIVQDDKPSVETTKRKATISLREFFVTEGAESTSTISQLFKLVSQIKGLETTPKIRYKIQVKGRKKLRNYRRTLTTRKNEVTFKKLKPGKYKVRYKLQVVKRKKVIANTGYSSGQNFSISK